MLPYSWRQGEFFHHCDVLAGGLRCQHRSNFFMQMELLKCDILIISCHLHALNRRDVVTSPYLHFTDKLHGKNRKTQYKRSYQNTFNLYRKMLH